MARTYLIIRTDRIRTHVTLHFSNGEHDIIFGAPAGRYLIHFASDPKAATSGVFPATNVMGCHIMTSIDSSIGQSILKPTSAEHMSFVISGSDAFQAQKLSVSVSGVGPAGVYMDVRPTF
ncbi:MAG: hypothetical protein PHY43_09180 [Verrucomicrobiales bacterium]|nr:hypothetical protein [Verrucomicrobiales bacterium]